MAKQALTTKHGSNSWMTPAIYRIKPVYQSSTSHLLLGDKKLPLYSEGENLQWMVRFVGGLTVIQLHFSSLFVQTLTRKVAKFLTNSFSDALEQLLLFVRALSEFAHTQDPPPVQDIDSSSIR